MRMLCFCLFVLALNGISNAVLAAEWQPADGPLMTRWAADVSPGNALPEYPRPQMVREQWLNLNGLWQYSLQASGGRRAGDSNAPADWDGEILVPFCIESALSGVMERVGDNERLWYRRTFERPAEWNQPRTLLHFGAVDWQTTVWINGHNVGVHEGGYDPFTFDITDALTETGDQEIVVAVWDPTDTGPQPRGKQVREPRGIWYTPVTGIWQTVWLEPVAETYIRGVAIETGRELGQFSIAVDVANPQPDWKVGIYVGSQTEGEGAHLRSWHLEHPEPMTHHFGGPRGVRNLEDHLWTPENPHLIDVYVALVPDPNADLDGFGQQWLPEFTGPGAPEPKPPVEMADHVQTYGALRKIHFAQDEHGFNRLFLNNKPLFHYGPLDQGWWPDGLYTAPTDEALRYDIEVTRRLGFNMARKHVKVEPARWYYWCDKLGLLVWQDMPNGDRHIRGDEPDIERSTESEEIYRREWQAIIEATRHHPSIVAWVPFNEGWGQFKTNEILAWTKELDATRLVGGPSGWTDRGAGDLHDMHRYPGPAMFPPSADRVSVLGEYGGLGLPLEGHTWLNRGNWGYRSYESRDDLIDAYEFRVRQLPWLIGDGLAAAIYTQTTDVEIEVNGLMTYDREIIKFDEDRMQELHALLYSPAPKAETLVPTSRQEAQTWRYTTNDPGADWFVSQFDDTGWNSGPGGFGTEGTPGTHVRSTWDTPDIWLRRDFELQEAPADDADIYLRLHHDEDAKIYINGQLAADVSGYVTDYITIPARSAAIMQVGTNTIAVHCKQTGGGQSIDVGIVTLSPNDDE